MNSRRLQSLTGKFRPLFSYFEEPEIISQKAVRKRDEGTGESLRKVSSSFSIINSRSSRINVVLVQLILRERPSGTSNSLSLSVFISILDLHSFYLLTSFLFHVLHRCFLFQFLLTELPQHYSQSLLDSSSRISQSFPFNFLGFNAFCFYFLFFKVSFTFILAWTFISLQIKEFRIMGLSINDSVYSCVFFFLTGLHFFHLVVGLLLLSLLFWSCSL